MKIHWSLKLATFVASVMALSWFFAGWRGIHEAPGLSSWGALFGGTLLTLLLLAVQGYWIYFEEKGKGTLQKRIAIFENIHSRWASKCCHKGSRPGGEDASNVKEAKGI